MKHLVAAHQTTVGFIGTGIIGRAMCRASNCTAGGGTGWTQGLLYDNHSTAAAQKFADGEARPGLLDHHDRSRRPDLLPFLICARADLISSRS